MLYAYSPGTEPTSSSDIDERYPGDDYVDIIGFDAYDQYPISDETASLTGKKYTFQKTRKRKHLFWPLCRKSRLCVNWKQELPMKTTKALLETGKMNDRTGLLKY